MSLHFSDILDSAFFTVCGIWNLKDHIREICSCISSDLPKSIPSKPLMPISLFWALTCVPGFEYMPWWFSCCFGDQVERKFDTHFWQVIHWVLAFVAYNNDLGTASQMLLTEVKLSLWWRLMFHSKKHIYMSFFAIYNMCREPSFWKADKTK